MIEERRRSQRQEAGWVGKWRIEDDSDSAPSECKILNFSMLGAGVEISKPHQGHLVGQKVTVNAQPLTGGSVSLRLLGEIRYASRAPGGRIQLGIEFVGLSKAEMAILDALSAHDSDGKRDDAGRLNLSIPLSMWECPTPGCQGILVCEATPQEGRIAVCQTWGRTSDPHCGRRMSWNSFDGCWVLVDSRSGTPERPPLS